MKLDKSVFTLDAEIYVSKLCTFIRDRQSVFHRDGILVPFSGGLDSSTVLLLCTRAVGVEKVTALLLPERQGNPEANTFSRLVTRKFKIKTITRNISPILSRLGTYHFILSVLPFRAMQDWASKKYMQSASRNPFLQMMKGSASPFQRKGYSKFCSKQRVRALVTYLIAEELNDLVVGSAHKSENMLGLFVKFGVDDCADIMPLKNLYRSQIIQLAAYLGVPDEILNRTPNPDIIPGISDKYMDILGFPSDLLDLLIYGLEHGLGDKDIASQLHLSAVKVHQIRELVQQSAPMRHSSQTLSWE